MQTNFEFLTNELFFIFFMSTCWGFIVENSPKGFMYLQFLCLESKHNTLCTALDRKHACVCMLAGNTNKGNLGKFTFPARTHIWKHIWWKVWLLIWQPVPTHWPKLLDTRAWDSNSYDLTRINVGSSLLSTFSGECVVILRQQIGSIGADSVLQWKLHETVLSCGFRPHYKLLWFGLWRFSSCISVWPGVPANDQNNKNMDEENSKWLYVTMKTQGNFH